MSYSNIASKIPCERWWRIIPVLILVNIISYIDRINVGFAIAGGMSKELGMTAGLSGMAAGIFFVGYMVLQVPGGHIAEKGNAKKFIGLSILGWGGLTILTGFVQNSTQLLIMRFLLGVSEGGVWPAIFAIIAHWFPAEESGRANSFFVSNTAIAAAIAGPLSGFILSHYDWRMLFFIQGTMSLVLIFIWWPLISNRPEEAKWISKEEKEYLTVKIAAEQEVLSAKNTGAPVSYKFLWTNVNMWKLILIYFCYQVGNYGYVLWLPSIVKEITKSGMSMLGFLNALPFIVALLGLYIFGWLSDKKFNRRRYTIITLLGFAAFLLLSTVFQTNVWLSFGLLVMCGFFLKPATSLFWTMPPLLFPSDVLGGVRGIINALGNLGGLVGPAVVGWVIWLTDSFIWGIYIMAAFLVAGAILTATMPKITAEPLKK